MFDLLVSSLYPEELGLEKEKSEAKPVKSQDDSSNMKYFMLGGGSMLLLSALTVLLMKK